MKIQFSRASEKIWSHFFSRFFEIETLVNDWSGGHPTSILDINELTEICEFPRLSELFRLALVVIGAGGEQIEALDPSIFEITAIFAYLCLIINICYDLIWKWFRLPKNRYLHYFQPSVV